MSYNKISKINFAFILVLTLSIVFCILLTPIRTQGKNAQSENQAEELQAKARKSNSQIILRQIKSIKSYGEITYGKSGLEKNLICEKIAPYDKAKSKILITFEIHGYEDLHPKDGQILVNIGDSLVNYYKGNRKALKNSELYIIPSLNPDGLSDGYGNNGPGRCQVTMGIDINRDFDYNFKTFSESRNHTKDKPFSAPETQALRDLVNSIEPDVVIDCHGWDNMLLGNGWIADCFRQSLNIYNQKDFTGSNCGYFSAWAGANGAKAMLLEYPPRAYESGDEYAKKTIYGLNKLIEKLNN